MSNFIKNVKEGHYGKAVEGVLIAAASIAAGVVTGGATVVGEEAVVGIGAKTIGERLGLMDERTLARRIARKATTTQKTIENSTVNSFFPSGSAETITPFEEKDLALFSDTRKIRQNQVIRTRDYAEKVRIQKAAQEKAKAKQAEEIKIKKEAQNAKARAKEQVRIKQKQEAEQRAEIKRKASEIKAREKAAKKARVEKLNRQDPKAIYKIFDKRKIDRSPEEKQLLVEYTKTLSKYIDKTYELEEGDFEDIISQFFDEQRPIRTVKEMKKDNSDFYYFTRPKEREYLKRLFNLGIRDYETFTRILKDDIDDEEVLDSMNISKHIDDRAKEWDEDVNKRVDPNLATIFN